MPVTICLAMIVRDEAAVLRRCLESVRPLLDHWVIVDTGSTDDTPQIARDVLDGLPGEVVHRSWVDFGHNRSEAVELARRHADYLLVIDADEVLEIDPGFTTADLEADAYRLESRYGSQRYCRIQLLNTRLPWAYRGVVHEYPDSPGAGAAPVLEGFRVRVHHDGARSRDPHTYRRDALLLEQVLIDEPDNPRNRFYLAQSYRDCGEPELAIMHYRARVALGGSAEEVWYSLYQIARIRDAAGVDWGSIVTDYLTAYDACAERAEPLYWLASGLVRRGQDAGAALLLDAGLRLPRPGPDRLFVDADVYDHLLPLAHAEACVRLGRQAEAITICNRLLRGPTLPPEQAERARRCRRAALDGGRRPVGHATGHAVRIVLVHQRAGDDLDGCLESIAHLNPPATSVMVLDLVGDACVAVSETELSARVVVHTSPDPIADGAGVGPEAEPDDLVAFLPTTSRLAAPDVLAAVAASFGDPGCAALIGQYRRADGGIGDAEPASEATDLAARSSTLAARAPLFFRAHMLSPAAPLDRLAVAPSGPGALAELNGRVLRAAGWTGTRFTDTILTCERPRVPEGDARPERARVTEQGPVVSCLMVTRDRLSLARVAIDCLRRQTHRNLELVLVTDGPPRYGRLLRQEAIELGIPQVRLVQVEGSRRSLGALRNLSLEAASGEFVCQWDDDDCYHPERVERQLQQLRSTASDACLLTDHLQYLYDDQAVVWVDWTLGGRTGYAQLLPGTVLMRRGLPLRYPESGRFAQRGEDSVLLDSLTERVPVAGLRGQGHLYLYTYHGRNTFDRDHHHRMAIFSRSAAELRSREDLIRRAMGHYPVPRPYLVVGRDGPAFWGS